MIQKLYENNVIIPLQSNKAPAIKWGDYNLEKKVPFEKLEKFVGFACGFNGVEVIDVDNHFGDADDLFQYIHDNYDIQGEFPIVKTQGGGYHIYFRCDNPRGNLKFAKRGIIENDESRHKIDEKGNHSVNTHADYFVGLTLKNGSWYGESTLIESRGVGGYVVCPPSPGYELIEGDLFNIPFLTENERAKLISICQSLNEVKNESVKSENSNSNEKPGDIYNRETSIEEICSILRNGGWKSPDNVRWSRPGKEFKDGISATLGKTGDKTFYVFSSNAHPFEDQKTYSAFAVYTMLNFGGDYNLSAKSLVKEKPIEKPKEATVPSKTQKAPEDDYIRVGDNYFKKVTTYDKNGNPIIKLDSRNRQTIIDDYSKHFISAIKKYDGFCNIPSHTNYNEKKGLMFNMYNKVEHNLKKGEFKTISNFMNHIFGEQVEMGYDYIQILYKEPTHILPVLCLVSKENETGKSTFGNFLHCIFGSNYANIGSGELNTEFNGSYATKLVAMIDEGYIAYKVIDKLKHMATAPTIMLRQMRRDHTPIDFFCKFILCSNRVKEFIVANKEDERYWIRKISKFENFDPNFLKKLKAEVPAFIEFLMSRELSTKRESRMHFSAQSIRTDALEEVVRNSIDLQTKDFIEITLEIMESNDILTLDCTLKDLKDNLFANRHDITTSKIKDILNEHLELKSSPYPIKYEFLKNPITKKGRCYSIDIEVLKKHANISYEIDEDITPF